MQQIITCSLYLHCVCNGLGEFGRVYKGTWIYKNVSGNTISEIVAVKTVKGTYVARIKSRLTVVSRTTK